VNGDRDGSVTVIDSKTDSNTLHVMNEFTNDMVTFDLRTMRQVGGRVPIGEASFGGGIRRIQ
jgi:hypothetical protein